MKSYALEFYNANKSLFEYDKHTTCSGSSPEVICGAFKDEYHYRRNLSVPKLTFSSKDYSGDFNETAYYEFPSKEEEVNCPKGEKRIFSSIGENLLKESKFVTYRPITPVTTKQHDLAQVPYHNQHRVITNPHDNGYYHAKRKVGNLDTNQLHHEQCQNQSERRKANLSVQGNGSLVNSQHSQLSQFRESDSTRKKEQNEFNGNFKQLNVYGEQSGTPKDIFSCPNSIETLKKVGQATGKECMSEKQTQRILSTNETKINGDAFPNGDHESEQLCCSKLGSKLYNSFSPRAHPSLGSYSNEPRREFAGGNIWGRGSNVFGADNVETVQSFLKRCGEITGKKYGRSAVYMDTLPPAVQDRKHRTHLDLTINLFRENIENKREKLRRLLHKEEEENKKSLETLKRTFHQS